MMLCKLLSSNLIRDEFTSWLSDHSCSSEHFFALISDVENNTFVSATTLRRRTREDE